MFFLEFHLTLALNIMYPSPAHVGTQCQSLPGHTPESAPLFSSHSRGLLPRFQLRFTPLWEPDSSTLTEVGTWHCILFREKASVDLLFCWYWRQPRPTWECTQAPCWTRSTQELRDSQVSQQSPTVAGPKEWHTYPTASTWCPFRPAPTTTSC